MIDLKPGFYRLSCAIVNPHPDRRYRVGNSTWKFSEKIYDGMHFRVKEWESPSEINKGLGTESRPLMLENARGYSCSLMRHQDPELWDLVVAALEPIPRTVEHVLRETGHENSADDILQKLVNLGVIHLGTIEDAIRAVDEDYDREEEERRAREEAAEKKRKEIAP